MEVGADGHRQGDGGCRVGVGDKERPGGRLSLRKREPEGEGEVPEGRGGSLPGFLFTRPAPNRGLRKDPSYLFFVRVRWSEVTHP